MYQFQPLGSGSTGFSEAAEVMLPDTLFLEAAKEALDEAVLLRGLGRDELLTQAVIPAGDTKALALKDQAIVLAHYRSGTGGPQRAETRQAGLLEGAFSFLGPST